MAAWNIVSISSVCEIQRGGSPRPIEDFITDADDGINWIKIGDVATGAKYVTTTKEKIRPEGAKRSREVRYGDFLLSNSMSFGRPYILRTSGCIHDGWLVLRYDKKLLTEDYLYHVLSSDFVYAQFVKFAVGAVVKNLNSEVVKHVKIPLPPISEQRRIAAILDQADALRAKRREALAQLDSLTQSIFIEMFGDPARNPRSWPIKRLEELVPSDDTINYGVVQPGDDVEDGVPLVRVGDLIDGHVHHSSLKRIAATIESAYRRSRLKGDEILVSCVGSVGVVALADRSVNGYNIARAVARVRLVNQAGRKYVASHLRSLHTQRYFTSELRTVSQPTLNIKQLSETKIMCPPMQLQEVFAARIEIFERVKAAQQASLASANALFASLQHRAFRGEL